MYKGSAFAHHARAVELIIARFEVAGEARSAIEYEAFAFESRCFGGYRIEIREDAAGELINTRESAAQKILRCPLATNPAGAAQRDGCVLFRGCQLSFHKAGELHEIVNAGIGRALKSADPNFIAVAHIDKSHARLVEQRVEVLRRNMRARLVSKQRTVKPAGDEFITHPQLELLKWNRVALAARTPHFAGQGQCFDEGAQVVKRPGRAVDGPVETFHREDERAEQIKIGDALGELVSKRSGFVDWRQQVAAFDHGHLGARTGAGGRRPGLGASRLPLLRRVGVERKRVHAGGEFVLETGVDGTVSLNERLSGERLADQHDAKMGFCARAAVPGALIQDVQMRGRKDLLQLLTDSFGGVHAWGKLLWGFQDRVGAVLA